MLSGTAVLLLAPRVRSAPVLKGWGNAPPVPAASAGGSDTAAVRLARQRIYCRISRGQRRQYLIGVWGVHTPSRGHMRKCSSLSMRRHSLECTPLRLRRQAFDDPVAPPGTPSEFVMTFLVKKNQLSASRAACLISPEQVAAAEPMARVSSIRRSKGVADLAASPLRRFIVGLIALMAGSTCIPAYSGIVDLPPVKVTAKREGGGADFSCRGIACSTSVNEESLAAQLSFLEEFERYPDELPALDPVKVCKALRQKRPPGCNYSESPSVPGFDSSWTANGCGTGVRANWFLNAALSQSNSATYSGDLNAPFAGVSFLAACNSHDLCWGKGSDRAECDQAFRGQMEASCMAVPSGSSRNICIGYASLYHAAVSTTDASHEAYGRSASDFSCAVWTYDMKTNGCNP